MDKPGLLDFNTLAQMSDQQLQQIFGIRDHFAYGVSATALAAAGTATMTFQVQTDSNFLWQAGAMQVDTTNTRTATPFITFTLTDASSGRQLMNAAVPLGTHFGTGELPFLLPTPRFFRGGTQVTVGLTNYSTATTYTNVYLAFLGTKFFKFAQAL